jgi:L-rhamnose mutarotase
MANSTSKNYTNKINTYMEYSELHNTIKQHLGKRLHNNELTNNDIKSLIDMLGGFLNLKTYAEYSQLKGISYNGVLARLKSGSIQHYELFGVKFIIDND